MQLIIIVLRDYWESRFQSFKQFQSPFLRLRLKPKLWIFYLWLYYTLEFINSIQLVANRCTLNVKRIFLALVSITNALHVLCCDIHVFSLITCIILIRLLTYSSRLPNYSSLTRNDCSLPLTDYWVWVTVKFYFLSFKFEVKCFSIAV